MKMIRITNTTNRNQNAGHFIDFGGTVIPAGKSAVVDLNRIDHNRHGGATTDLLERWAAEGKVQWGSADQQAVAAPASEEAGITRGTQFNEVAASNVPATDGEDFQEGFDPENAKEATLPGTHAPDTKNVGGANVSLGGSESSQNPDDVSPIPGARPRNVDNSDAFTVRAPKS